jgi:hypothetical protein
MDFNTGTIRASLNYTLQISHIKSSLQSQTFKWALLQLTCCHFKPTSSSLHHLSTDEALNLVSLITPQHEPCRNITIPLLCLDWLHRDVYRTTDHRKHHSSVAMPLLHSCLLLWECVYRIVAQKQPWYILPSHGRCTAMALHATLLPPLGYSS